MGCSKNRWKMITFLQPPPPPPKEFICPITQSLMADPVIVSSGQTLERACVEVCQNLNFTPSLGGGLSPSFSTVIPNIALKLTILHWCDNNTVKRPNPISLNVAEKLVRALMVPSESKRWSDFRFSSEESVSSFSSEDAATNGEEEKILVKLRSCEEEGVGYLRQITRTDPTVRIPLCTPRILSAVGSFLVTRRSGSLKQLNSIAALVNLSLENVNKVKIVRSGAVPALIEILKYGSSESVEYSVSLLFSLSMDDQNKTAIGVLGGLGPLLHLVKSEKERVSRESLLCLYHLSLVESNRSKLIKLKAVRTLLSLGKSTGIVLRILCNLVKCAEGRAAVLDENGVRWLFDQLVKGNGDKCVEVLHGLSCGSMRFRGLAKAAGAEEMLSEVVEKGSGRVREKAKRMLVLISQVGEEEVEEVDWEKLLFDSDDVSQSRFGLGAKC